MAFLIQSGTVDHQEVNASELKHGRTNTFVTVNFPTAFPVGVTPVVLTTCQSFNGCNSPGIRIADVTNKGFKIRMNEIVFTNAAGKHESLGDGLHKTETIGWIAIST